MRRRSGRVEIPGPVLTASGCSAFGQELEPFVDLTALGAVVTKSVQLRPRSGRPTPRMAETPSGMLNSIGLQGPGIDGLLAEDLPWLAERGARAFVSIAGTRVEDFAELAERLRGVPGRARPRGQHQLPERGEPRRGVRLRSGRRLRRHRRRARRRRPRAADLRQAQPRRHRHRLGRPRGRRRRCRRAVDDQHAARAGHRPRHHAPGARRGDRRPVRAGDPAGGAALRLAGARRRCRRSPSSAWAASGTAWTPCSSSWRAPRAVSVGTAVFNDPSAPARIHDELAAALAARGFASLSDAVGYAHRAAGVER